MGRPLFALMDTSVVLFLRGVIKDCARIRQLSRAQVVEGGAAS